MQKSPHHLTITVVSDRAQLDELDIPSDVPFVVQVDIGIGKMHFDAGGWASLVASVASMIEHARTKTSAG